MPTNPTLRITRLRGTAYSDGIQTVTDHGAPVGVVTLGALTLLGLTSARAGSTR